MTGSEDQSRQAREEAEWRAIVENYGDRPELPEPPDTGPPDTGPPAADPPQFAAPDPGPAEPYELAGGDADEHFVPPPAPPVPRPQGLRLIAWSGVFGVPALALVLLLLGVSLPSLLGLGMIVWFVGGFGYLVATMSNPPPGEGPGGWDDGAVL